MTDYAIDGYALRMWSTRPTTDLNPGVAVAGIYYYQGSRYRGYVYFFPDGTPLAAPIHDAANGRVFLHFNLSQLHAVLDVLCNEKPLVVYGLLRVRDQRCPQDWPGAGRRGGRHWSSLGRGGRTLERSQNSLSAASRRAVGWQVWRSSEPRQLRQLRPDPRNHRAQSPWRS
jgi:hypothetical protein